MRRAQVLVLMAADFRGFCDAAGIWRPMGRWGRDGVWQDGRRRRPGLRAGVVTHPLTGVVVAHGVIDTGDGQRVTMAEWSDAVKYDEGVSVAFRLSDGQAVSVRGASRRTNGQTEQTFEQTNKPTYAK